MSKAKRNSIEVQGTSISILSQSGGDYISLTDMLRAKEGEPFISDRLRNPNTVEFLGIWESVFSPKFKIYLLKEFRRLKDEKIDRLQLGWNLQRTPVHTLVAECYVSGR